MNRRMRKNICQQTTVRSIPTAQCIFCLTTTVNIPLRLKCSVMWLHIAMQIKTMIVIACYFQRLILIIITVIQALPKSDPVKINICKKARWGCGNPPFQLGSHHKLLYVRFLIKGRTKYFLFKIIAYY